MERLVTPGTTLRRAFEGAEQSLELGAGEMYSIRVHTRASSLETVPMNPLSMMYLPLYTTLLVLLVAVVGGVILHQKLDAMPNHLITSITTKVTEQVQGGLRVVLPNAVFSKLFKATKKVCQTMASVH